MPLLSFRSKADARLHIHGKAGLFTVAAGVGEDGGTIGPQFQRPGGVELVELVLITGDAVTPSFRSSVRVT